MANVINIKSDGRLNFVLGSLIVITSIDDPLMPTKVISDLNICFSTMSSQGITELHMEENEFKSFTHIVKAGSMEAHDSITDPVFAAILSAKAELDTIYSPPTE
jgi:hypothetical protein